MEPEERRPHVTVIDAIRHKAFLHEQRVDPVSKEPFRAGDRVVICAADRSAFLEDSWIAIGGRHCGQTETLEEIPVAEEARPFRRPANLSDEPQIDYEDRADDPRPELYYDDYYDNAAAAAPIPTTPPTTIPLRELPIALREIPLRLREITEL